MIMPNLRQTFGARYDHRFQVLALASAPLAQREQFHTHRRICGGVGFDPRRPGVGASLAGGMGPPQRRGLANEPGRRERRDLASTDPRPASQAGPPAAGAPETGSAAPIADLGSFLSFYFFTSTGSGGLLPSGMPTRPAISTDDTIT